MMADVYENADRVCVWLGDDENDGELALDFINKKITNLDNFDHIERGRSEKAKKKWEALTALLTRNWFERRWVVQEIALGKNAVLHCGQQSVTWAKFTIVVALFERASEALAKSFKASALHDYNPNFLGTIEARGATRLVHVISNLLRRSDTGEISWKRHNASSNSSPKGQVRLNIFLLNWYRNKYSHHWRTARLKTQCRRLFQQRKRTHP